MLGGGIIAGAAGIAGLSYLGSEAEKGGVAQRNREQVRKSEGSGLTLDLKALGDVPSPLSEEAQKLQTPEKAQAYIMSFTADKKIIDKWMEYWQLIKNMPDLIEGQYWRFINSTPNVKNYDSPALKNYLAPFIQQNIIKNIGKDSRSFEESRDIDNKILQTRAEEFILREGNLQDGKIVGKFEQGLAYVKEQNGNFRLIDPEQ